MSSTQPGRPRQLLLALALLTIAAMLNNVPRTALVVSGLLSGRIESGQAIYKAIDEIVIWGFTLGFISLIAWGVNWARWANVALVVLNLGLHGFLAAKAVSAQNLVAPFVFLAIALLEIGALLLLFFSPARHWFERTAGASSGSKGAGGGPT